MEDNEEDRPDAATGGYLSSNGQCFDVGLTVTKALREYWRSGNPFSGTSDPKSAGNGCLMRLVPVPMFYFADRDTAIAMSGESARTTHGASECIEATRAGSRPMCSAPARAAHGATRIPSQGYILAALLGVAIGTLLALGV